MLGGGRHGERNQGHLGGNPPNLLFSAEHEFGAFGPTPSENPADTGGRTGVRCRRTRLYRPFGDVHVSLACLSIGGSVGEDSPQRSPL